MNDNEDYRKKTADYEGKLYSLTQELERTSANLRGKLEENANYDSRLRALSNENEKLKRESASDFDVRINKFTQ
jgi:hypothetical protein